MKFVITERFYVDRDVVIEADDMDAAQNAWKTDERRENERLIDDLGLEESGFVVNGPILANIKRSAE